MWILILLDLVSNTILLKILLLEIQYWYWYCSFRKVNIDIGNINILLQYIAQQYIDLYPCLPLSSFQNYIGYFWYRPLSNYRASYYPFAFLFQIDRCERSVCTKWICNFGNNISIKAKWPLLYSHVVCSHHGFNLSYTNRPHFTWWVPKNIP